MTSLGDDRPDANDHTPHGREGHAGRVAHRLRLRSHDYRRLRNRLFNHREELTNMTARSYLMAAAVALAVSGTAFAQSSSSTSTSPSGSSSKSESSATHPMTAADCQSLTGASKDQCMRDVQRSSTSGGATGATSGTGTGTGAASRSESSPGSTGKGTGSSRSRSRSDLTADPSPGRVLDLVEVVADGQFSIGRGARSSWRGWTRRSLVHHSHFPSTWLFYVHAESDAEVMRKLFKRQETGPRGSSR